MIKFPLPSPIIDGLEQIKDKSFSQCNILNQQDFEYALDFLKQYGGNKSTFEACAILA